MTDDIRKEYGTELESCVLAIIHDMEPCTAYAVRMELEQSSSSFWSGSSGSIYPLMRRLEARGLVKAREEPWGGSKKKLFRVTSKGRKFMKRWLTELPEWSGLVSLDPIRTRIFWLGSLTARERTHYLDEAEALTLRAIRRIQERIATLEAEGRPWHAIGTEGALRELEARLRWLRDVRARR